MEYKIAKYTGQQLAKMGSEELIAALGAHVRSLVTKASRVVVRENYDTEAQFTKALVRKQEAEKSLYDYIDEQREFFKSKRLNPDRAYTEAIFPTGETLPNGTEIFKIVPRGFNIEPEETDPESNRIIVRITSVPSMNVKKDQTRGRFNDGGLLIAQSSCSVDRSEVLGI